MWKKVVGYGLLSVFAIAALGIGYLYLRPPKRRPPSPIKVAMTKERIERGKYIFQLADCSNCHSMRDPKTLAFVKDGLGGGSVIEEEGAPGPIGVPNITPDAETGIGGWTDGEKIRAIREGIGRDGRALFPMMPYESFRHMSDDDVQALVAYLNSLPPVRNRVPRMQLNVVVATMIKGAPRPVTKPVSTPSRSNPRQYGEYLVTLAGCQGCHTPGEGPHKDLTKRFAGGRTFRISGRTVTSANITPDQATGIGSWSQEYFRQRFHIYRDAQPQFFTIMPWNTLAQLPDDDLNMIYDYLRSQPPVENKVQTRPAHLAEAR